MRRPKVLAAHDDTRIVADLTDVFTSLRHTHDRACSQQGARQRLQTKKYSYLVLDLDIPARLKGGASHSQNGLNLLEEIRSDKALQHLPVIVLVGARSAQPLSTDEVLELAMLAMRKGATHVVMKPLGGKRRLLDQIIKKALAGRLPTQSRETAPPSLPMKPTAVRPFSGGEMVFYPDRVELCGVKIASDMGTGQSRAILDLLRHKRGDGRYVSLGGEALAKKLNAVGGMGTVTGCIRTIRQNATQRLKEKMNLVVANHDVVTNDGKHGYSLQEWITVRDGTDEA